MDSGPAPRGASRNDGKISGPQRNVIHPTVARVQIPYITRMTNRLAPVLFAFILSLTGACIAHAEDEIPGFQSPSKNIGCMYSEYDGHKSLRCDVGDKSWRLPKPASCEQEWGNSFEVDAKGPAGPSCTGDTQIGQPLRVLPYGEVWQRGGITCKSEDSGITCFNADRRGFSLSRAKLEVF
jgi:hypothetical protein